MRRDLVDRLKADTKVPVSHVEAAIPLPIRRAASERVQRADRRLAAVPEPAVEEKESLLANRVYLGMVMFLGSEAMLFGSFFTAFFFLRFTSNSWPTDRA